MESLNIIAADIVEVAVSFLPVFDIDDCMTDVVRDQQPAYDTNAELTTMAAADAMYEIMSIMVKKGPLSLMDYDADEEQEDL